MIKHVSYLLLLYVLQACHEPVNKETVSPPVEDMAAPVTGVSLVVLGTMQDAGSPQAGCTKDCCKGLFGRDAHERRVVSLGLVDAVNQKKYLFEATPDFTQQAKALKNYASFGKETPDGIFLTHAHIGHYMGLVYLGKESMNADTIPVYAMPRMRSFLELNGPWSQLVKNKNIALQAINDRQEISLGPGLTVTAFMVPHRDEFSETVGYTIRGPKKKALFIPDIDKWEKWDSSIINAIAKVDYAFLDATFYDAAEINNRDISTIPHPFMIESMRLFEQLPAAEKKKIWFIHFNHTNPVIDKKNRQATHVLEQGFNIAAINDILPL